MMQPNVCAGLDMGGTGIRIVIMREERVLASTTISTASFADLAQRQRISILAQSILGLLPYGTRLIGVGIGASGPVNVETGVIDNPYTLPAFSGFPLAAQMETCLQVPVRMDNDATTAALGEHHFGAGIGSSRMLMVTLGTGVGVALLDRGKPFRMANGSHPEAGHIAVSDDERVCYCGLTGCWESLAARSWLQTTLMERVPEVDYRRQRLVDWLEICRQSPEIASVFYQYGRQVGKGLGSLLMAYGPDTTVLSGSAASLYPLFEQGLQSVLQRAAGFEINRDIHISLLGDTAGAMGATRLLPDATLLI